MTLPGKRTPTTCKASGTSPDRETWKRRAHQHIECPACGQRVRLYMRKLDGAGLDNTRIADHAENGRSEL